jgi:transketolase
LDHRTKTTLTYNGARDFEPDNRAGKNLHFSIREHAMAATVNGFSLSKLRAFGATFFIFSDYARPVREFRGHNTNFLLAENIRLD